MTRKPQLARRSRKNISIRKSGHYLAVLDLSPGEKLHELTKFNLDYASVPQSPDSNHLRFYARGEALLALRKDKRSVTVLADTASTRKAIQKYLRTGDRFNGGKTGPAGVGVLS